MLPPTPAEVLVRLPHAVLSHEEAARRLGIELLADNGIRRITVPRNSGRIRLPGWRVSRADLVPSEVIALPDGHRVTAAVRTVADLCRVLTLTPAVVAADSALRRELVRPHDLRAALQVARGNGSAQIRQVATLTDALSGSVLESALRVLMVSAGIPAPRTQFWVADGVECFARVDFCWPEQRLIVEADGFAFHSGRDDYRRDRTRMNELERLGWRVLRFTWEDVMSRQEYIVSLVRSCLARAAA